MEQLKRLLAINDLSGIGKCSLTVALPVVSATGVECACMPTTVLSTHTAVFQNFTVRDLSDQILPMAEHWKREGLAFDGICTGYMANAGQAELIAEAIRQCRGDNTLVIVDPAMADNGHYYAMLGDDIRDAFRKLLAEAHVVTPNVTEAALLTGIPYQSGALDMDYVQELLRALVAMGPRIAVVTSVYTNDGRIGNVALDAKSGEMVTAFRPVTEGRFHGTGDLFTAAFSALLLRGASLADAMAVGGALLDESIQQTVARGTPLHWGVAFEGALPAYIKRVEALFS